MSTGVSVIKQFEDQVRMTLISKIINGISRTLEKLLKYFDETIILTSFGPLLAFLHTIFAVDLKEALLILSAAKSAIAPLASENRSSP